MTAVERIDSIISEIEHGYISWSNMYDEKCQGLRVIEESLGRYRKYIIENENQFKNGIMRRFMEVR